MTKVRIGEDRCSEQIANGVIDVSLLLDLPTATSIQNLNDKCEHKLYHGI